MKVNLIIICSPRNTSKWHPRTNKRQSFKPDFQYVVRPFDVRILNCWRLYMDKPNERMFSSVTQIRIPWFCVFDFSFVSNRFNGIRILWMHVFFFVDIKLLIKFPVGQFDECNEDLIAYRDFLSNAPVQFPHWCGFVSCEQRRL